MATADRANLYLAAFAAEIDKDLAANAPKLTFALVVWVKGRSGEREAVSVFSPPAAKSEAPEALTTLAEALRERMQ